MCEKGKKKLKFYLESGGKGKKKTKNRGDKNLERERKGSLGTNVLEKMGKII